MRELCARFDSAYWQRVDKSRGVSRRVRQSAHRRRMARGAHSHRVRRRRTVAHRSVGHSRGDQPLRRELRRVPRADVHHGHAAAARLGGAEAALPAQDRVGRAAPAVVRRHRADDGNRHDEAQDVRRATRRPLRRERAEGLDLAHPAFRPDAAARAHDAARRREEEVRRPVGVSRRARRTPSSAACACGRSATW